MEAGIDDVDDDGRATGIEMGSLAWLGLHIAAPVFCSIDYNVFVGKMWKKYF